MEINGFIMCVGKWLYFLPSEKQRKSKTIIDQFITAICKKRGIEAKKEYYKSIEIREDIAYRTSKGKYKLVTTDNGYQYHHFEEKNCVMNFPLTDCEEVIFLD